MAIWGEKEEDYIDSYIFAMAQIRRIGHDHQALFQVVVLGGISSGATVSLQKAFGS